MIGRNDACPCGSGKKYKKCCAHKDVIDQKVATTRRMLADVLKPDASVYKLWLEWRGSRAISDFNFLYDVILEGSPMQQRLGDRHAFVAACDSGTAEIPSGKAAFRYLRINEGATAELLQTIGEGDPTRSTIVAERIRLAKTEAGWRFTDFHRVELRKEHDPQIGLALFDAAV